MSINRLVWRICVLLVAMAAGNAQAETDLGAIGGGGGGTFRVRCVAPAVLSGIEVRSGDYVDALRSLCVDPSGLVEGEWQGGFGGGVRRLSCPANAPIVWSIYVGIDQDEGVVNDLLLYCNNIAGTSAGVSARLKPGEAYATHDDTQGCGRGQLAVGLHGRSGKYIDAIGLVCASPPSIITGLGKTASTAPVAPKPAGWTICDSARDARARNSPAATNLEAQCRNSQLVVTGVGKKVLTPSTTLPATPPPTAPAPAPPSPPAPTSPTKEETRQAAMQALAGAIVSTVQEARENARANRTRQAADDRVQAGNEPRRRGPLPRDAHATADVAHDGNAYELAQPDGSIRIQVRYPVAYGHKDAAGLFDPGPNSCGAFYISAVPTADVRPRDPTRIDTQPRMRSAGGMYVCEYLIHDQPIGSPVIVRVAMSDQRAAGSETWLGGSQPQPPSGQRRTIPDGAREIVLNAGHPRASLAFEMVYSGAP